MGAPRRVPTGPGAFEIPGGEVPGRALARAAGRSYRDGVTHPTEPLGPRWTYAQVNALEDRLGERFELVDGHIFAMAGETERHHDLRMGVYRQLYGKGTCKPFSEGIRIKVTSVEADFRYPDASVFCEPRRHWQGDERLFTNPTFLFEVTSASTAAVDHGAKVREYLVLESLEAYVVVSSAARELTVYRRGENGVVHEVVDAGAVSLGRDLTLDVDALYAEAGA